MMCQLIYFSISRRPFIPLTIIFYFWSLAKNEKEHVRHLQFVFDRLREAGLKFKPTICAFVLPKVNILG